MCILSFQNCSRPGGIINMTMSEVDRCVLKNQLFVIYVHKHKTANICGPATIFVSETDMSSLRQYISLYRLDKSNHVFTTSRGCPLSSSNFCRIFRKWMGHSTTCKRKVDAEKYRNHQSEKDVSVLMLHSLSVHARNYQTVGTLEQRLNGYLLVNSSDPSATTTCNNTLDETPITTLMTPAGTATDRRNQGATKREQCLMSFAWQEVL